MKDFTVGKRLRRDGGPHVPNEFKVRLLRLEERRQQRMTLKILYERKAASVCGIRDRLVLERQAE
jgi:hypothetical protein